MLHIRNHRLVYGTLLTGLIVALFIVFPLFRGQGQPTQKSAATKQAQEDTTRRKAATPRHSNPTHPEMQVELENAMKELATALDGISKLEIPNIEIEIAKALKEANKAMKEVNIEKIQREVDRAIRETDLAAIERDIAKNISAEELARAKAEFAKVFKEIDHAKMKADLSQLKQLNKQDLERSMQQLKEALQHSKLDMKAALENARNEMEEAHQVLQLLKSGLTELEKDGLIKKGDSIDIDWENETLMLNGTPQTKEVSDKYRKYFPKGSATFKNKKAGII